MENFDFGKCVAESLAKTEKEFGKTNILIVGKTGVGKSTLINAVFRDNLATTGIGKPCTQYTKEITKEGVPVSIFDTKGLELKDYKTIISELEGFILERRNEQNPNRQIHAAWVCIQESTPRVEDAEIELTEMLYNQQIPVIAVLTKASQDNGFSKKVEDLLPNAKNIIRVRAIETVFDGGIKMPPMNLEELVNLTHEVLPEGKRNAFIASQKASLKQKVSRAQKIVATSATAAATAGAVPIPFADAAILVPIQVSMLVGISKVFGLDLPKSFIGTLVSSVIGSSAATIGGKAIVSGLFKCIPGIGSVAGATISGATAAALTTAIGEAYIGALSALLKAKNNDTSSLSKDEITRVFKEQLAKKKK